MTKKAAKLPDNRTDIIKNTFLRTQFQALWAQLMSASVSDDEP